VLTVDKVIVGVDVVSVMAVIRELLDVVGANM
jgi:hypothetical protein